MNLKDFFHNGYLNGLYQSTDKDRGHDYITAYYNDKLSKHKFDKISILEIGIYKFDSIKLFRDFFVNAKIIGVDSFPQLWDDSINDYVYIPNVSKYSSHFIDSYSSTILDNCEIYMMNAYSEEVLNKIEDNSIDFIIEDGSHRIEDQLYVVENWTKKLKTGGTLIIEDIQDINHSPKLIESANKVDCESRIIDLRSNMVSYDNILFEVIKK
jgi:hypothetical protein